MKDAIVTIPLVEIDNLRKKISRLETLNQELNELKKPMHYFRIYYDFSKGTSVNNSFGCEVFNEDEVDNRFEEIVKSNFEEIFTQSKQNKFYNKFPSWVHKLFNCK
jgi:hypothetical protein